MIIKLLGVTGVLSVFYWFTNTFPIKSLTNIHILGTETSKKKSQKKFHRPARSIEKVWQTKPHILRLGTERMSVLWWSKTWFCWFFFIFFEIFQFLCHLLPQFPTVSSKVVVCQTFWGLIFIGFSKKSKQISDKFSTYHLEKTNFL